jgi:hypothetical protein
MDNVHNQDDANDCFEFEVDVSKEKLESLKNDPNYKNIDEALNTQEMPETMRGRVFFTSEEKRITDDLDSRKYVLQHYYNKSKGVYIVMVNFSIIIREGVNPCPTGGLPYVILVDEPKYMSLYGRGMHEQLESAKYELNITTNQIIDLVRESSTNTLLLGENASLDDEAIVNGVGRVLNISGGEYQWSTPPQSDKGLFNLRQTLQQDATMITGVDAYSVGGDTARTLGQEEIREVNRLKSLSVTVQAYNYFLVRMAQLRLAYIQFYVTKTTGRKIIGKKYTIPLINKKIEKIKGVDGKGEVTEKGITFKDKEGHVDFLELTPTMIRSSLDITVETPLTSTTLKALKKQQRKEIYDSAIQAAQLNPAIAQKLEKFLQMSLEEQIEDSGSDPDKFFEKNEGDDKKQMRSDILGDLPQPFKPSVQPERQNTDELAMVAGENLETNKAE